MINEANASSSACRLWRIPQVETSFIFDNTDGERSDHDECVFMDAVMHHLCYTSQRKT